MPYADIEQRRAYHREYFRKWKASYPEKVKGYAQNYREANREKERARVRASYQRHAETRKAAGRRYYWKNVDRTRELRMLAQERLGGKCVNCGESCGACLDFHHVDRESKEMQVAKLLGGRYGMEKIMAEVDKCVLLCRNCHAIIHWDSLARFDERNNASLTTPEGSLT